MAPLSLSDLAPELITDIFKSLDNFQTVSALSRTSHQFHDIWTLNITTISQAVLPHTINYFPQAHELYKAQEQAANIDQSSKDHTNQHLSAKHTTTQPTPNPLATAINLIAQYHSNETTALAALHRFSTEDLSQSDRTTYSSPTPRPLTPPEKSRFIRSYYLAAALATISQHHTPALDLIKSWNVLDVLQVADVIMSLVDFANVRSIHRPSRFVDTALRGVEWEVAARKVLVLKRDLLSYDMRVITKIFERRQHQSSMFLAFLIEGRRESLWVKLGENDNIIDMTEYKCSDGKADVVDCGRGESIGELFELLGDETREVLRGVREWV